MAEQTLEAGALPTQAHHPAWGRTSPWRGGCSREQRDCVWSGAQSLTASPKGPSARGRDSHPDAEGLPRARLWLLRLCFVGLTDLFQTYPVLTSRSVPL